MTIGNYVSLDTRISFEGYNVIAERCEVHTSTIGLGTYISQGSSVKKAIVGRFCSIGRNLQTGLGLHPSKTFVSTHPAFFSTQGQAGLSFAKENTFKEHIYIDDKPPYVVVIGNDVWIGNNVTIMDGITIGDGAILATGAVVTRDVPPYAIAAGIPAKITRFRFTEVQIEKLLDLKWWDWSLEKIKANAHLFGDIDVLISSV